MVLSLTCKIRFSKRQQSPGVGMTEANISNEESQCKPQSGNMNILENIYSVQSLRLTRKFFATSSCASRLAVS